MDMVNIKLLNGDFTAENLVKTFDANLVETWYDPEEREIKCTDAFDEARETGVLKINDTGASYVRVHRWLRRNNLNLKSRGAPAPVQTRLVPQGVRGIADTVDERITQVYRDYYNTAAQQVNNMTIAEAFRNEE